MSSRILTMKYGLFVHYVAGLTTDRDGVVISDVEQLAEAFDLQRFADDLEAFGVEYLKFTAWHAAQIPLYPSAVQEAWRGPGKSATRDLIGEIIGELTSRGIAVILYTHPRVGHSFSEADMIATGWGGGSVYLNPDPDPATFDYELWNRFVQESYAELLQRYGDRVEGIYLDEGDENGLSERFVDYPVLRSMTDAYPHITILQNFFGSMYLADVGDQERAGPTVLPSETPNAWSSDPDFVMSPLIAPTWYASVASTAPAASRPAKDLFRYTVLQASANRVGLGTSWSAGVYSGEGWENGIAEELVGLNEYLAPVAASVKHTLPSSSYPTAHGATIDSLTWGVATQSPDDLTTYLHVLVPPKGRELTLPAPADGKKIESARLLADGAPVVFSQSASRVTLSLPAGNTWSDVDTVFALSTSSAGAVREGTVGE